MSSDPGDPSGRPGTGDHPTLDATAEHLYRLRPDEFVAERDRRSAELRRGGDRELAAAVKALRRPTAAAWLVNLLAHERPDAVRGLLETGGQMRTAQADGDAATLRELTVESRQQVSDLVAQAVDLADGPISAAAERDVAAALGAALADPAAAEQLRLGRLAQATGYAGLGPELGVAFAAAPPRDATPPPAAPRSARAAPSRAGSAARSAGSDPAAASAGVPAKPSTARTAGGSARRAALAAAVDQARADLDARTQAAAAAIARRDAAADEVDRIQQSLDEAHGALGAATREVTAARRARDEAARALAAAERKAERSRRNEPRESDDAAS